MLAQADLDEARELLTAQTSATAEAETRADELAAKAAERARNLVPGEIHRGKREGLGNLTGAYKPTRSSEILKPRMTRA